MLDFNAIQEQKNTIKETVLGVHIESWAEVFSFDYDKSNLNQLSQNHACRNHKKACIVLNSIKYTPNRSQIHTKA